MSTDPAFVYPTLAELDAAAQFLDKTASNRPAASNLGKVRNIDAGLLTSTRSEDAANRLGTKYPLGFVRSKSAQELFGLSRSSSGASHCSPIVMSVTDLGTVSGDVQRPQVYISGEIHGDERVVSLLKIF